MKKSLRFFLYIMLIGLFCNCEKGEDDGANTPTAIVIVKHYYTGRRAPLWDVVHVPSINVTAHISGNLLPKINNVQIADQLYSDPALFYYSQGEIYFSPGTRIWEDSIQEPKFNPLTIKINTNNGTLEGSITVPDTIKTVTIDAPDTIALNTPLTISWSGSNADYYLVQYFHTWMIGEYGYLGYSEDTMVQGNNLILVGSQFSNDGDISEFEITPINGPLPSANAIANITGDGFGFLYLENKSINLDRTIAIGKGIDYSFWEQSTPETSSKKASSEMIVDKIESLLLQ